MNKQKLSILTATILGIATLVPVLANAQSAQGDLQVNAQVNAGGPNGMMRGGRGFGRMNGRGMMPGVMGKVTAISGNTITLSSMMPPMMRDAATTTAPVTKIITVDASSAVVMKDKATSTIAAIVVGDNLFVEGKLTGTNIVATKIRDGMGGMMRGPDGKGPDGGAMASLQGNGQPIVAGNITAINGNTLTITNKSNVSYTVDATNAKVVVKNATSSLAAVAIGDMVVTQGTVNGNAVVATTVIDQGNPSTMMQPQNGNDGNQNGQPDDLNNRPAPRGFFGGITSFFTHLFGF